MVDHAPRLGSMLPSLQGVPPGPESRRLVKELAQHESPAVSTIAGGDTPIVWRRARGANVEDVDGNVYIDLSAAFGVASLGHGHPAVAAAVRQQSRLLLHGFGDVHPHELRVELAKRLATLAPMQDAKVILCNTGAEAVEVAMKTATLFTGKKGFLAYDGGFHGQTYGALAVTSRERFRSPFREQIYTGVARAHYPYCYRCPLGLSYPTCGIACLDETKRLLDHPPQHVGSVAAVIVEPVQGREGDVVPPADFLPQLRDACSQRGVLLILDEMITGFSRTGAWFAANHRNVEPDLLCVGKALGNGLPISACIGGPEVMASWPIEAGEAPYSSTFMANPVSCAAALATLSEHERLGLAAQAKSAGDRTLQSLQSLKARHPLIGDVRGLGMMLGLELVKDHQSKKPATDEATRVIRLAMEGGVILLPSGKDGNVISLSPPLTITHRQLTYCLGVLERCLTEVERDSGIGLEGEAKSRLE